ncbi:3-hydroxybutyryl-CoA dehydrogenase [Halobacteriales archaeon QS_5_68_33]|nr:MAG: 3-hydroxybutyryl-CoA dehydrogenase [Halobacteriales archaeon QS_5_68_33]
MVGSDPAIERVAVVGAGRMGHGIALVYALDGREVALYDADPDALAAAPERVETALATMVEAGAVDRAAADAALANLRTESTLAAAVADVDFVTEAVAEDLAVKRSVFADLADHAPADALLATNTSGLSIADIARDVADASRVLGTHWFNPPHIVPLVEVVKGPETTDAAAERTRALLDAAGKTPVVLERELPGFIGNRIQAAMTYEAYALLARGVASAADIDRAVKAGFGFRLPVMGIFEKVDQSGLDVHHEVEKSLMPDLDRGTDPNPVVTELVERGETGWEAGRGVYDWTGVDRATAERERDRALLALRSVYEDADAGSAPPESDTPGTRQGTDADGE